MEKEEFLNDLSEEIRQKLAACKTAEEAKKVLAGAGIEPLDDELLDDVTGGLLFLIPWLLGTGDDEEEKKPGR